MENRTNSKKKAKLKLSIFVFFLTICLATLKVYTKVDSGCQRSREICDRIFVWREGICMNKGKNKQKACSLSHNTSSHKQHFTKFQNPRCFFEKY